MTAQSYSAVIDRLVADLARATGRSEQLIRLAYGIVALPDSVPAERSTEAA
jgi:hypothetical protein